MRGSFGSQHRAEERDGIAHMASAKAQGSGLLSRLGRPFANGWRFLKDVHSELHRVVWPTHEETYSFTVVVILAVGIVAAFVGVLDLIMVNIMMALGLAH
jgi:preprotein translocase subunit SecE